MSTKTRGRFLIMRDSLVSLKKILWMAYEVNSKDNRKHGSYQIFLKTAKNSVLHSGKVSQWMIVLMRWCNSAFWLFHDNVLLELGKTGSVLPQAVHWAEIPSSLEKSCCFSFLAQTHKCCEELFGVLTFRVHMWGKNSSLQTNSWFPGDYSLDPDY